VRCVGVRRPSSCAELGLLGAGGRSGTRVHDLVVFGVRAVFAAAGARGRRAGALADDLPQRLVPGQQEAIIRQPGIVPLAPEPLYVLALAGG
jgi:hypothetical protein